MRSNYKRLWNYIREVDVRNTDLSVNLLLWISIQKIFIPSIANTIWTDMTTYKIVKKNQFGYWTVTSRNGDKISIALLEDHEEAIVSQAYKVFEIIDENKLLPEYLMMWFRRPEFDRYARFKSHGSAREIFDWQEMCDVELPVPDITKQQEIVDEYNTIKNRISLNDSLIRKLEETAQAVYREWFVDFEFLDENWNPYKSSGWEMEFCEELEKEVPKGWKMEKIKDYVIDMKNWATPSRDNQEYRNSHDIPWIKTWEIHNNVLVSAEEYISEKWFKNSSTKLLPINTVLMAMYWVTAWQVWFLKFKATTNQACCAMICENIHKASYLYYHLLKNQEEIANMANGGAQSNLSKNLIEELFILSPKQEVLESSNLSKIIDYRHKKTQENENLWKMKDLILSKMASEG